MVAFGSGNIGGLSVINDEFYDLAHWSEIMNAETDWGITTATKEIAKDVCLCAL